MLFASVLKNIQCNEGRHCLQLGSTRSQFNKNDHLSFRIDSCGLNINTINILKKTKCTIGAKYKVQVIYLLVHTKRISILELRIIFLGRIRSQKNLHL